MRLYRPRWDELPTQQGDAHGRALTAARRGQVLTAVGTLVRERLLGLPPLALGLWLLWGLGYLASFVLFVGGALRLRPRVLALVLVATVFYVTFLPGPISQIRFRLPVVPAIIVLMVVGMGGVWKLVKRYYPDFGSRQHGPGLKHVPLPTSEISS